MIISKLYVMSKRDKLIAYVISFLLATSTASIFILSFIILDFSDKLNFYLRIISALICTFSVGDLISLMTKSSSIAFLILRYIKFKRNYKNPMIIAPTQNDFQKKVCEGVFGSVDINLFVYMYGLPDRGKTTTAFLLLDGIFLNKTNEFNKIKNIIFIDCSNNKDKILEFFSPDTNIGRVECFKNSIIVLDNIEYLGTHFIENNSELFGAYNNLFILIEDSENGRSIIDQTLLSNAKTFDFNNNIIESTAIHYDWNVINSLNTNYLKGFFVIYFLILTNNFAHFEVICELSKVSPRELRTLIKLINKSHIFSIFPFNHSYLYCTNKMILHEIEHKFASNSVYNDVLNECLVQPIIGDESKWIYLIKASPSYIKSHAIHDRHILFDKALQNGRYKYLYDLLNNTIDVFPVKKEIFFYELGILNFHMGNHKMATTIFSEYMKRLHGNLKKDVMLHLIESNHGNCDPNVMKLLNEIIEHLLKDDSVYGLYAKYWKIHIDTEKGIFDIAAMQNVRYSLLYYTEPDNSYIYSEILKRCYTDELRMHHILGVNIPVSLIDDFTVYLKNRSIPLYDYYYNLYIMAHTIHYLDIVYCSYSETETRLTDLIEKAKSYYEKAKQSQFVEKKSRRALSIRQEELNMILVDYNAQKAIKSMNEFLLHSQINDVDVHVAFCETLLAKIKIIDNKNFNHTLGLHISSAKMNIIKKHLKNAEQIYTKYENIYGVFRVNFLELLFNLFCDAHNKDLWLDKLNTLAQIYCQYTKEVAIINELTSLNNSNNLSGMYIYWKLRTYPIILQ